MQSALQLKASDSGWGVAGGAGFQTFLDCFLLSICDALSFLEEWFGDFMKVGLFFTDSKM